MGYAPVPRHFWQTVDAVARGWLAEWRWGAYLDMARIVVRKVTNEMPARKEPTEEQPRRREVWAGGEGGRGKVLMESEACEDSTTNPCSLGENARAQHEVLAFWQG